MNWPPLLVLLAKKLVLRPWFFAQFLTEHFTILKSRIRDRYILCCWENDVLVILELLYVRSGSSSSAFSRSLQRKKKCTCVRWK